VEDNMLQVNHHYQIQAIQKVCHFCAGSYSLKFFYLTIFHLLLCTAFDADSRYLSAEDQNRELTRSIRREVAKLTEQWNHLINRSDNWKHRLDEYMTVSSESFCYFI
jgi:hypothetical protein